MRAEEQKGWATGHGKIDENVRKEREGGSWDRIIGRGAKIRVISQKFCVYLYHVRLGCVPALYSRFPFFFFV